MDDVESTTQKASRDSPKELRIPNRGPQDVARLARFYILNRFWLMRIVFTSLTLLTIILAQYVCLNRTLLTPRLSPKKIEGFLRTCNKLSSIKCLRMLQNVDSWLKMTPTRPQCFNLKRSRTDDKVEHLFHAVWFNNLTPAIMRFIKSFLFTQNLALCKLIIWIKFDAYHDQCLHDASCDKTMLLLAKYSAVVELRRLDYSTLEPHISSLLGLNSGLTPMNLTRGLKLPRAIGNHFRIFTMAVVGPHSKQSDFYRMAILLLFGGTYVDVDTIFLRDTQPLWTLDFVTSWGSSGEGALNTAFINFGRGSLALQRLFLCLTFTQGSFHPDAVSICRKKRMFFHELPCEFTDPLWRVESSDERHDLESRTHWSSLGLANWTDAFADRAHVDKGVYNYTALIHAFDGAYAYHWHNNWQRDPEPLSFLGLWEARHDAFLAGD